MLFGFNFYSTLLLLFFSNGMLYATLLLKRGIANHNASDTWLSLFLFLCNLYIAPWMLGFAGWYDNQPYRDILFYVPFQHLFFLGPIIYFYVQSVLNPNFRLYQSHFWHFIPGILYLIYNSVIVVTDKIVLDEYYFLADGSDKDFDDWYQRTGLISMFIYFTLSLRYYQKYRKLMYHIVSFADNLIFKWIKIFLVAFLSMQLLQVLFLILGSLFPAITDYIDSWWYYLCFSIVMYYIAFTGYYNTLITKIPFKFNTLQNNTAFLLPSAQNEDTAIIKVEENFGIPVSDEIIMWKNEIIVLFESEHSFQDPELTLTEVASRLNTNAAIISKTINQGFQMNFNDFVNQYRVKEVKKAFEKGDHKKQTLLAIALSCGFNSKATFNRAFKKHTGYSPKEYLLLP